MGRIWFNVLVAIFLTSQIACNSEESKPVTNPKDSDSTDHASQKPACDLSCLVKGQGRIEPQVLRSETKLDTIHFYGDNISFVGDTVFLVNEDAEYLLVDASDGILCMYTFLFAWHTKEKRVLDHLKVATDCDRDDSLPYSFLTFEVNADTVIIAKHSVSKGSEIEDAIISGKEKYILSNGQFIAVSK